MQPRTFAPGPALAPHVRSFVVVETGAAAMTRTLLPDTRLIVGFRYAGSATLLEPGEARRLPGAAITGLRGTARRMYTAANSGVVLAVLREASAGRFLDLPLHELFGETRPLDDLVPAADVERTAAAIAEARGDPARVAAFERFLQALARPEWRPDPLVQGALRRIDASAGSVRVGTLADAASLCQDAFEKRFRRAVGATPKTFASIVRLQRALAAHRAGQSLTQASLDAGYCDQSHFIRQFRRVTGAAPRRFLAGDEYC